MPCRDDQDEVIAPSENKQLKALTERTHALAASLCQARSLIFKLTEVDGNKVPLDLIAQVEHHLKEFRAHRNADKRRAVDAANATCTKLRNTVKQIKALGGIPGPQLDEQIRSVSQQIAELEASDPINTTLY